MQAVTPFKQLSQQGFVYLPKQSEEALNELLTTLGDVIQITDVTPKSDSKSLVTSTRGLDFHTDHHKAKFIVWYCYKQCSIGGESLLLDALELYNQLLAAHQKELQHINLFEHKVFPDDPDQYPLLSTDNYGKVKFYYSFWLVKNQDKYNPALLTFQQLIRKAKPVKLKLQPTDILIVDNHRVFHARTPIEGNQDRWLKRFWLSKK
ncbi:MAG: TauD/TfdA family dioxygenase [Raineya sp.]